MSVAQRIIRASAVLAGLIGSTARGDAILTLGVFSSSDSGSSAAGPGGGFLLSRATTSAPSPSPAPSGGGQNLATTGQANRSTVAYASPGPSPASQPVAPRPAYDAFVNLGPGPFADSDTLTTGNPRAWYDSPQVAGLFGGRPTARQAGDFGDAVLRRVEQTFQLSGVPVSLTDDPADSAAHSLGVVSGAVNPSMTDAIGVSYVGGNGFHYIDNAAGYARSVDQLGWIVAHNVAHELMLAFGVPEVHDQTGEFVDSTRGDLAMFLDPNATFSTGAVQDLLSKDFKLNNGLALGTAPQLVDGAPVPEPATLALWALGTAAVVAARRARSRRAAA